MSVITSIMEILRKMDWGIAEGLGRSYGYVFMGLQQTVINRHFKALVWGS